MGILSDSFVFKYNGEPRNMEIWEQDLTLRDALQYSCVPCYQSLAQTIGVDSMRMYLDRLGYDSMTFDETSIDQFWLIGKSRINQFEQIEFLQKLYQGELAISEKSNHLIKEILIINKEDNGTLSGKTGWSIDGDQNNGWFVGYLESEETMYYFATNIEPTEGYDMSKFPAARRKVIDLALRSLRNY